MLPHAGLNINWKAVDKPKKQGTRMLKAECQGGVVDGQSEPCGYTIRLSKKWAELGAVCPAHGPMQVELPPDAGVADEDAAESVEE